MESVLYAKSFEYAVETVKLNENLVLKHKYELGKQLLRSGTSVGANVAEAQYAQSDSDFLSKLSIALKEASENRYWLKLSEEVGSISASDAQRMITRVDELIKMLTASIKTVKSKKETTKTTK